MVIMVLGVLLRRVKKKLQLIYRVASDSRDIIARALVIIQICSNNRWCKLLAMTPLLTGTVSSCGSVYCLLPFHGVTRRLRIRHLSGVSIPLPTPIQIHPYLSLLVFAFFGLAISKSTRITISYADWHIILALKCTVRGGSKTTGKVATTSLLTLNFTAACGHYSYTEEKLIFAPRCLFLSMFWLSALTNTTFSTELIVITATSCHRYSR